jgi:hypothetical protein
VAAGFYAPVQIGRGAHSASYTMGTGFILGVKRPGRGVKHPLSSSVEIAIGLEVYPRPPRCLYTSVGRRLSLIFGFATARPSLKIPDGLMKHAVFTR